MNIKEVKDLIQEILQSDISEFELEHTGTRVRLRRGLSNDPVAEVSAAAPVPTQAARRAPVPVPGPSEEPKAPEAEVSEDDGLHFITSPIVGTFYRAPSVGADPFVQIGSAVEEGTVLCIVEAMKLMNEIPSDVTGEVVKIFVENSHPVEFGEKLFGIRPRT